MLANRFELRTKVADGPIAAVWRGSQRAEAGFERPVAVRVLKEPWDRDRAVLAAWASAATELAERASPHVEQVLDVVIADGRAHVVSEWIEGISLRRWLADYRREGTPVPWPLATAIAIEVLRALSSAHAGTPPLCHEGVGVRSVRLARGGTVKLTRFGVAPALAVRGTGRRELEELGLFTQAPELLDGESVRPSSDVFAVGALLFEMLGAQPPFGAKAGEARDAAMRAGELTDLSTLRADVPPLLVAQVERALALEIETRFDSAAAMIRALARLLQSEAEASAPEALAASVAAVLDRPKPEVRPQGLPDLRTMHVDLADVTVLPRASAEDTVKEAPSAQPERPDTPRPDTPRPQRYRFGYKERRASIEARTKLAPEASETAPLPLTRRADPEPPAKAEPQPKPAAKKPKGLVAHKTEFLDADQVDRLTLGDVPKGLAAQKTEFLDAEQVERLTLPDAAEKKKK